MAFWMTAVKDGSCHECGGEITSGDRIVYDPEQYIVLCKDNMCGVAHIGPDKSTSKEMKAIIKDIQTRRRKR